MTGPVAGRPILWRCTRKLARLIGDRGTWEEAPDPDRWSEWYGNLLWLDRRKCILVVHAETLFGLLVADVRAADLSPAGRFLVRHITDELASEGFPTDVLGALEPDRVRLATTASRSVLGSMNDIAFQWEAIVRFSGGLASTDVATENRRLRRMPMGAIGCTRPIDAALGLADR